MAFPKGGNQVDSDSKKEEGGAGSSALNVSLRRTTKFTKPSPQGSGRDPTVSTTSMASALQNSLPSSVSVSPLLAVVDSNWDPNSGFLDRTRSTAIAHPASPPLAPSNTSPSSVATTTSSSSSSPVSAGGSFVTSASQMPALARSLSSLGGPLAKLPPARTPASQPPIRTAKEQLEEQLRNHIIKNFCLDPDQTDFHFHESGKPVPPQSFAVSKFKRYKSAYDGMAKAVGFAKKTEAFKTITNPMEFNQDTEISNEQYNILIANLEEFGQEHDIDFKVAEALNNIKEHKTLVTVLTTPTQFHIRYTVQIDIPGNRFSDLSIEQQAEYFMAYRCTYKNDWDAIDEPIKKIWGEREFAEYFPTKYLASSESKSTDFDQALQEYTSWFKKLSDTDKDKFATIIGLKTDAYLFSHLQPGEKIRDFVSCLKKIKTEPTKFGMFTGQLKRFLGQCQFEKYFPEEKPSTMPTWFDRLSQWEKDSLLSTIKPVIDEEKNTNDPAIAMPATERATRPGASNLWISIAAVMESHYSLQPTIAAATKINLQTEGVLFPSGRSSAVAGAVKQQKPVKKKSEGVLAFSSQPDPTLADVATTTTSALNELFTVQNIQQEIILCKKYQKILWNDNGNRFRVDHFPWPINPEFVFCQTLLKLFGGGDGGLASAKDAVLSKLDTELTPIGSNHNLTNLVDSEAARAVIDSVSEVPGTDGIIKMVNAFIKKIMAGRDEQASLAIKEFFDAALRGKLDTSLISPNLSPYRNNLSSQEELRDPRVKILTRILVLLNGYFNINKRMERSQNPNLEISAIEGLLTIFTGNIFQGSCKSGKDRKGMMRIYMVALMVFMAENNNRMPDHNHNPDGDLEAYKAKDVKKAPTEGVHKKQTDRQKFVIIYADLFVTHHMAILAETNADGSQGLKDIGGKNKKGEDKGGVLPKDIRERIELICPGLIARLEENGGLNKFKPLKFVPVEKKPIMLNSDWSADHTDDGMAAFAHLLNSPEEAKTSTDDQDIARDVSPSIISGSPDSRRATVMLGKIWAELNPTVTETVVTAAVVTAAQEPGQPNPNNAPPPRANLK